MLKNKITNWLIDNPKEILEIVDQINSLNEGLMHLDFVPKQLLDNMLHEFSPTEILEMSNCNDYFDIDEEYFAITGGELQSYNRQQVDRILIDHIDEIADSVVANKVQLASDYIIAQGLFDIIKSHELFEYLRGTEDYREIVRELFSIYDYQPMGYKVGGEYIDLYFTNTATNEELIIDCRLCTRGIDNSPIRVKVIGITKK